MRLIGPRFSARMLVWFGVLTTATVVAVASQLGGQWTLGGHDASNTRYQDNETRIDASNVSGLAAKWTLNTLGDVSATPAVKDGIVYVPDWAGQIYGVDANTGGIVWQVAVVDVTGVPATGGFLGPGGVVRTTPAVAGNLLIVGDQGGRSGQGAKVFALNRRTGAPVWMTQIQGGNLGGPPGDHFAIVTQPPVVDENNPKVVYVGTASWEEAVAAFPIDNIGTPYPCCSFRGAVTALDIDTGQILWQTYMAPAGYSGNGVWGSTGAIDAKRKTLYVTTGNNYSVPQEMLDCVMAAGDDPDAKQACLALAPDNYVDAIVALNTDTGAIRWATNALPYDAWNVDCLGFFGTPIGNCPEPDGPDYDFAQGPALFNAKIGGRTRDLIGAGQKSGVYWTLDRDTGQVIWSTHVGPGGTMGGLQWGSAVDDQRIYVAVNNSGLEPWTPLGGTETTGGAWSALDKATGEILWQTATPDPPIPTLGSAIGAVTVANGVAYGCTFLGSRVAMNAGDGGILWTDPTAGELCGAGAAVSRGTVYWGTGYGQIALQPVTDGTLTAYSIP